MIELRIKDGAITTIYSDKTVGVLEGIGSVEVGRASQVEWEEGGWTVRSARERDLAIREGMEVSRFGKVFVFRTRAEALIAEHKLFFKLL